jgi:hypothetical protein
LRRAQPNVLRVEVISDVWNAETKKQEKLRHITIRNTAPWIFRKVCRLCFRTSISSLNLRAFALGPALQLLRAEEAVFQEKSYYDPEKKELEIVGQNVTFASIVLGDETSRFFVHPENPKWFVRADGGQLVADTGCAVSVCGVQDKV